MTPAGEPHGTDVGLDVSQELTSVCVVDQQGTVIWRGKCATDPDAIAGAIRRHAPRVVRAGLETGLLSNFLTRALRARSVPVVCLDGCRIRMLLVAVTACSFRTVCKNYATDHRRVGVVQGLMCRRLASDQSSTTSN